MFEQAASVGRRDSASRGRRAATLYSRALWSHYRSCAELAGRGAGRTSRPVSRILCPPRAAGDDHPSGHTVTGYLERSTRGLGRAALPVRHRTSIRAVAPRTVRPSTLLRAGFTEPPRSPGVLVRSYRTVSPLPRRRGRGGLFSVALSRGSPRVAVGHHPALWSPDVPRRRSEDHRRDRLADSSTDHSTGTDLRDRDVGCGSAAHGEARGVTEAISAG